MGLLGDIPRVRMYLDSDSWLGYGISFFVSLTKKWPQVRSIAEKNGPITSFIKYLV